MHYPHAHVYALHITSHSKSRERLRRGGAQIIERHEYPTYWHAHAAKMAVLVQLAPYRCTAPTSHVPVGPTEV